MKPIQLILLAGGIVNTTILATYLFYGAPVYYTLFSAVCAAAVWWMFFDVIKEDNT